MSMNQGRIALVLSLAKNLANSNLGSSPEVLMLLRELAIELGGLSVADIDLPSKERVTFTNVRQSIIAIAQASVRRDGMWNEPCKRLVELLEPLVDDTDLSPETSAQPRPSVAEASIVGEWWKLRNLGSGGQGTVWKVIWLRKSEGATGAGADSIADTVSQLLSPNFIPSKNNISRYFAKVSCIIAAVADSISDGQTGALKVLRTDGHERDKENAPARMKREIELLKSFQHPAIVPILDSDPNNGWYVSEYFPAGSLAQNKEKFKGRPWAAVADFQSLVAAVKYLHERNVYHRDIKPANILIGDCLLLGDFGIAHVDDSTRLTTTGDNVGAWDWQPPWADKAKFYSNKPEDAAALRAWDIYSLGKVLWAMISGEGYLRQYFFNTSDSSLEGRFPEDCQRMAKVNELLGLCIVTYPEQSIGNCAALIEEVKRVRMELYKMGGADTIDEAAL